MIKTQCHIANNTPWLLVTFLDSTSLELQRVSQCSKAFSGLSAKSLCRHWIPTLLHKQCSLLTVCTAFALCWALEVIQRWFKVCERASEMAYRVKAFSTKPTMCVQSLGSTWQKVRTDCYTCPLTSLYTSKWCVCTCVCMCIHRDIHKAHTETNTE